MSVAWYWPDWNPANCSDPPGESCSDADCPVHGWELDARDSDDAAYTVDMDSGTLVPGADYTVDMDSGEVTS